MYGLHIVFTGGGTLGPVTPLLAVARAVREQDPTSQVSWIGTRGGPEERLVTEVGLPFFAISAGRLRRYVDAKNVTDAGRVVAGFFQARALLKRIGADAVVSAGGFVAVPVAWAAASLGIPVHIHQQDVIPGLANKLSLPVSRTVSVALESSRKDFRHQRVSRCGNPMRAEVLAGSRERAATAFGLEADVPTVLVLGGGTGAAGLNDLVRRSLPQILPHSQVIHLTGLGKADATVTAPRYHQYELLTKEMPDAFAAADLVVTRAGMGTLTEIAGLGKAAIIVPMPASHQEANAEAFALASGAPLLDQRTTDPEKFALLVNDLLADDSRRAAIAAGLHKLHVPDAAGCIAAIALDNARRHRAAA